MTEATTDIRPGQLFLFPKKSRVCVYELEARINLARFVIS
jgi:hypothetical protein